MKMLSLDTSSSAGSIVLSEDEDILGEINVDSSQTHTVRLLVGIDTLLKSTGCRLNDLDALAAVCGPGSFTGIRIGLTTVKGLADTLSKPIVSVTAFEAWVEKFSDSEGILVPVIDARRGEVYAAIYQRKDREVQILSPGTVGKPASIFPLIRHEKVSFVGDGAQQYRNLICTEDRPGWSVCASDPFLGRATMRIGCRRAYLKEYTSPEGLQAYYLRKSDAELHWKER